MSDRNVSCKGCSANMGTIRDARLRKDIEYFCTKCVDLVAAKINRLESEAQAMRNAENLRRQTQHKSPFDSAFADLFK